MTDTPRAKQLNIHLPADLAERLDAARREEHTSANHLVKQAIAQHLAHTQRARRPNPNWHSDIQLFPIDG